MDGKKIGVFDSGVGGLSVLRCLTAFFPAESFVYFGDNFSAPYGEMSLRRLKEKAFEGLIFLLSFNIKAVVVACNTLSVNCLSFIRELSPVPVVGVFPPVEGALMRGEKTLLLSTPKTAEYYGRCPFLYNRLSVLPLSRLAGEIEADAKTLASADTRPLITRAARIKPLKTLSPTTFRSSLKKCVSPLINVTANPPINNGGKAVRKSLEGAAKNFSDFTKPPLFSPFDHLEPLCPPQAFDTVILGCTHYFFAAENIFEHFCPRKIYGGEIFTCFALNRVLIKTGKNKNIRKNIAISNILFVGKCGIINRKFWIKHVKCDIKN